VYIETSTAPLFAGTEFAVLVRNLRAKAIALREATVAGKKVLAKNKRPAKKKAPAHIKVPALSEWTGISLFVCLRDSIE
jgi:hypothetical protein